MDGHFQSSLNQIVVAVLLLLKLLVLPALASAATLTGQDAEELFEAWTAANRRDYPSATERDARFVRFKANLEEMEALAAISPRAVYAPDLFADYSQEEMEGMKAGGAGFLGELFPTAEIASFSSRQIRAALDAGEVDWVARGAVTTPTSQGRCATCAYFAGVAAVEGAWAIAGHPLVKLSEQQEIDCFNNAGYAMPNIVDHGIALATDAPLANHSDPNITGCRGITNCSAAEKHTFARIDGVRSPRSHNDTDILPMLAFGPMAVSIDASAYTGYHGGVLNCSALPPDHHVDHANTLVGYGVESAPVPCAQQPENASYTTFCGTAWEGRMGSYWKEWEPFAASSIEECCSRCAGEQGAPASAPAWNAPACGAAYLKNGECFMRATSPSGHGLSGLPVPDEDATTCVPFERTPVPAEPVAYWKVKNSWGPAFGEGGYARLMFGNNCLRGVVQPYINKSHGDGAGWRS